VMRRSFGLSAPPVLPRGAFAISARIRTLREKSAQPLPRERIWKR
jgi:hypothetical protein